MDLDKRARAKCARYISMLEEHGLSLPSNYLEKVRGELWALRPEYSGNEYRIIFFFDDNSGTFVVVHAILKNTKRLDANDITTAENRKDDWIARAERKKEKS
ncbi:MAG TPA: type II toxin-antitoxin system RelE/ParE family toxin [Pyrinomonadaceae bacterium]|nr:type II toxin-antitoxin system RelE/ParE family toxin [Pyrinomonadaceae bacterium]